MIATINTATKTITIESSFKHLDWIEFFNNLPEDWRDFTFEVGTGEKQHIPTYPWVQPIDWAPPYTPTSPYWYTTNSTGAIGTDNTTVQNTKD